MLDESDLEKNVGTGGIETSISSDDDDEEEEGEGEGNSSSRRDNNNNEVEEGPTDEVDSEYANEELLEEVGALENYNFNDLLENKSANKFLRSEQKIKHKNRPIHQRMDNSSMISEWNRLGHQQQHMPADYPYQWSSNVANLVKTRASIDNKKQFELGLHGSPESKAKSANLVKLAKSIGLNEVFDLITLDAQQKLFG
ncbi:COP9 signalosome complex subunit 5 domain protein [Candida albicans]|uniref:COP9 signalosome complex subunit 5 domain protein n=1 Tax=Candida albicans TaxID=5476 RepID=A0A8H6C2Z1_CANAX|nr:COP9 signalosome complex subunit 5 domain protein [Candida albicans]